MKEEYPLRSWLANENLPPRGIPWGVGPAVRRRHALDILGFQPFVAGYNFEGHFVAFIQGFKSRANDGRVMHENVLAGTLGDEPEPFFVVKPLNFAASHNKTPELLRCLSESKKDTT
jgi:hypothetical protein